MEPITFGGIMSAISQFFQPLWKWLRKPKYIPLDDKKWKPKIKRMMERAGYYKKHTSLIPQEQQVFYQESEGRKVVTTKYLRKGIRSKGRSGEELIMMEKTLTM